MKRFLKIIGIIFAALLAVAVLEFAFVLQYPKLNDNPKVGKWYKISNSEMICANGGQYKAFFRKGSENKVLVYFAGGGSNIDAYTARESLFNDSVMPIDMLSNMTMNMGGIATASDNNPFKDWSVIAFPCATGDFMSGTGEFHYTDKSGKEAVLYHHGYTNYTIIMQEIMAKADIDNADTVLVTGYSAGGFSAALLADDIYTNCFPNASSKNLLIDASLLEYEGWHSVLTDVWHCPSSISDVSVTDNLTLDFIRHLKEKYGDGITVLFDSSTRDGDLAKTQNYYDGGAFEVDEQIADNYQEMLKQNIPELKAAGAYLYIWDGLQYYDDPRNMTLHTIIATPYVYTDPENFGISIAGWAHNATNGKVEDYGMDLVNKVYEKTE